MPTAAKLTAAVFFALLGWFAGDLVKPLLPEGTPANWLNETLAIIGALMGTIMSGRNAGRGVRAGFGYGLTTVALIAFWGIFAFAFQRMLSMSLDNRFKGPIEAIQEMVGIMMDHAVLVAVTPIVSTAIIGGLFGGWITEWVAKRWS